jgi:hypothetical protein
MPDVDAAYEQLAAQRGYEPMPKVALDPLTPLLAAAQTGVEIDWSKDLPTDEESVFLEPALRAKLDEESELVVGHLAYTAKVTIPGTIFDWTRKSSHRFDLAMTEIPAAARRVPRLLCIRRGRRIQPSPIFSSGFVPRHSRRWTETAALNERYEITISPYQDLEWMRRLFTSRFVDWLANEAPESFSFELVYGTLFGSIDGEDSSAAGLAALCDATARVAARIREECR